VGAANLQVACASCRGTQLGLCRRACVRLSTTHCPMLLPASVYSLQVFTLLVGGDLLPLLLLVAFTPAAPPQHAGAGRHLPEGAAATGLRFGEAAAAARRALAAALCHPTHMAGLCEAVREASTAAQSAAAQPASASEPVAPAAAGEAALEGSDAPKKARVGGSGGTTDTAALGHQQYQAVLLRRLSALLEAGLGDTATPRAAATARALLAGLPALLGDFCAAVKRHRRLLESGECLGLEGWLLWGPLQMGGADATPTYPVCTGAATLLSASSHTSNANPNQFATSADAEALDRLAGGKRGPQPGGATAPAAATAAAPRKQAQQAQAQQRQLRTAEMDWALSLLSLLVPFLELQPMRDASAPGDAGAGGEEGAADKWRTRKADRKRQRQNGLGQDSIARAGGGGGGQGKNAPSQPLRPAGWCAAARGTAGLLAAASATGAYAPTEDVGGRQRAVLARVAAATAGAYERLAPPPGAGGEDESGGSGSSSGDGGPATAGADLQGAAAAVVCAILDLEHR
jgi:hypothetical protein